MKSRKLGIGLLLLLAFVFTTGTFAYWASSVSGDQETSSQSVTIGEGDAVTTTVSLGTVIDDENTLVPTGYEDDSTTFDSTTFTFPVQWDAEADGAAGLVWDLEVTIDNQSISPGTLTSAEILDMFDFEVTTAPTTITEGAAAVNVVVTVTFANEPATQTIYNEVANGTISFDVTFDVTDPNA